ncbi:hypothetical protein ABMA28_008498 [Loxostege sticticalis]|uniref:HTH CENPB-type domain-containing protein n=1 Tax=Loxostege sticticalis TaxID=481309 RepID=A0ABD0SHC9_LOXSC
MPRTYVRKKIKPYTPEGLAEALQKIKNGELTITTAAEKYSIPKATLSENLHSKYSRPTAGRPTIFSSEEEERLADSIKVMEKWGFGLSRQEILEIVAEYVKVNEIKTPFKNNTPGPDWFINFRKRHRLSIKKAQPVEYVRKKMTDPFFIFEYFELLEKTLIELDLIDKPQNVWNLDETSLCLDPTRTKVVGAINKPCARTTYGSGKENITVLAGANAEGKKLPPLIVFKGKFVWDQWMAATDDYDFELSYAASPKGWMQTDIFYNYMKTILIPSLGQERPVLLVYDGHSTHVDVKVIELAIENNITILKLPPHTSHLLQPLDIAVFKSFKSKWDAKLVDWQRRNVGTKMAKNIFSKTLADTWQETAPDIIKNGFKKAGICPFDANVIPVEKYDPNAYKRYQIFREEQRLLQSQQNASSPESLKKICIDYINKQNIIPDETVHNQCPPDQQDETLGEPKSINHQFTNIPTENVTLLSQISKSDSQMTAFLAKDSTSLPTCLKEGRSDQKNNATVKTTASPRIFTFEEAFLKKIEQDKKNTVIKKKRISKGAEVITKSMSKKQEAKDKDKVTKKSKKKQDNKDSQSKNSRTKLEQKLDENRPGTSGLQKSKKRKRVPSMDSTTSISDIMSQYSDSEILDLDDLDDLEEFHVFKEASPNLDNKPKDEESQNTGMRKGKGKGKKSIKGKENQTKQEENESDSFMSKKSGSDKKYMKSAKKIKIEKGERYQESDIKEDSRDSNENDYKDERNVTFNIIDTVLVKKSIKGKENQTKEEENESDSFISKKSGSDKKYMKSAKKIKIEKGERYQESDIKEDSRDSNENDNKDERNYTFNINDTVLVRYFMRNKWVYYIGFIEKIDQLDVETYYTVDFLKTIKKPFLVFAPPKRRDCDVVPETSIVKTIKIELKNDNKKEYYLCNDLDAVYF